jgi:hypothetical protein
MSLRFAYLYLMEDDPDRVRATVPRHVAHWHDLGGWPATSVAPSRTAPAG